jgi:carbamoyltransferase
MANWYCEPSENPYKMALIDVLGPPLSPDQLWNPDAMLRVEDIHHRPETKDRLDKAAATQLVFEDAMIHVVDHLLRVTGASRLVLTGGVALNAVGNMRLLEHFDEAWFASAQQRDARLHLWVPPVPGDPGVTIGAAWLFAHLAGAPRGAPITHAFYCGSPPANADIERALTASDIGSQRIGEVGTPDGRNAIADLMAFVIARNGVIALYQGAAETGPRALGHRSILANACDPRRGRLNGASNTAKAIRPWRRWRRWRPRENISICCRALPTPITTLHGADRAIQAARAWQNPCRHPCRRHRPDPDRECGGRSSHPRLSEGARPSYRRRSLRQHLL